MAKEPKKRIYARTRNGTTRYYGDFRDYADVGGRQEALVPEGCKGATTDPEVAETLASRRLEALKAARRRRVEVGVRRQYGLAEFAELHLHQKSASGNVGEDYLGQVQNHLQRAVDFFGKDRELSGIRPSHVRKWIEALRETPNGRGDTLGEKTIRDHINSLSNMYRRAQSEEAVPSGYNPVADLVDKPTPPRRKEAEWLEPHEAALLLESARTYEPPADKHPIPFMYPLLATVLLTGGRKSEVLGLEVDDVSFDRNVVRFRPNGHRDLKTATSTRTVPMSPQLRDVLLSYLNGEEAPESGLLFPSPKTGKMISDVRRQLDSIGERVGFAKGEIRLHKLRHTYTAARIQTTDHGAPVALFTVARELGHASTRLIERRYGHLLTNRKVRGEHVEFRVDDYEEELEDDLRQLRLVA